MKIKSKLKSIIGAQRLSNMKGIVYHYGCSAYLRLVNKNKLEWDNKYVSLKYKLEEKEYHVFRGYYDLDYISDDNKQFLCNRLPLNANSNRDTKCEIGYYDLNSKNFIKIADTNAWCWQQGSRLRWNPLNKRQVIFNDISETGYCAKIYNIANKKCVDIIDWPLYDITQDFKWGLSLNYSRLQRLRPGYGYNYFEDETKNIEAPKDDGIVLVDLQNRKSRVIYTIYDLAKKVDPELKYTHYLNHISICPKGDKFIFFHIYTQPQQKWWNTVLYVSDIKGEKYKILEKNDRVSHYCWIDENRLMVTCRKEDGKEYYSIYDVKSGEKKIVTISGLNNDGHPSPLKFKNQFLTDTYPQKYSIQRMMIYSLDSENTKNIASIYHDYRLRGEKRCDLHPSISSNNNLISIDTTYRHKKRSILIFERRGENTNA